MSCGRSRREHDGVDWGKVADGVGLAGFGVFFLVATSDGLPPGFWLDALSFWPVLLISAGIRVIFDKSPLPWGVVLGPLVVLGTLGWLAWGDRPVAAPPGEWREVRAERPDGVERVTLDMEGAGARVNVEARPPQDRDLATGRVASRGDRSRLRERSEEGTATLHLSGHGGGATLVPGRKAVWELAVADDLPLEVRLGGVMNLSELHLERGQVSRVEAHGPFQVVVLRLPPPRGQVPVELKGPFSTFHLVVPDGTPVHLAKHFPMSLSFRGPARDEALSEGQAGYDVSYTAPFCSLTIEEAPLPEGVRPPEAEPERPLPAEAPLVRPPAP